MIDGIEVSEIWSCDPSDIPVYTSAETVERVYKLSLLFADIFNWTAEVRQQIEDEYNSKRAANDEQF